MKTSEENERASRQGPAEGDGVVDICGGEGVPSLEPHVKCPMFHNSMQLSRWLKRSALYAN
jgi:hypothetical protein